MKLPLLTLLVLSGLAGAVLHRAANPPDACRCGDICAKAAAHEQCRVVICDGKS